MLFDILPPRKLVGCTDRHRHGRMPGARSSLKRSHGGAYYVCCGLTYTNITQAATHLRRRHPEGRDWVCARCQAVFTLTEAQRVARAHGQPTYCPRCSPIPEEAPCPA